jgi:RHS repeat-associated protein
MTRNRNRSGGNLASAIAGEVWMRAVSALLFVAACIGTTAPAQAYLAPSYEWVISASLASGYWTFPWLKSGPAACAALSAQLVGNNANMNTFLGYYGNPYIYRNITLVPAYHNTWPSYKCNVSYEYSRVKWTTWYSCANCAVQVVGYRSNPRYAFISAIPPSNAQCGPQCNTMGDPISPATGGVHETERDLAPNGSGLSFRRTYSSVDIATSALSVGWRHSYSRSLRPVYQSTAFQPWTSTPLNSSQYTDEGVACTSGFAEIKSQVLQWSAATATYANGVCVINVGAATIATLPILYTSFPTPNPDTLTLIGYAVTRDDGQVINFEGSGSSINAPPGIALKLQTSGSGFTVTDESDNVEYYNADGKLQTVTSRTGVVQTIGYDTSGRPISVVDSFGQAFTLAYDSQGRLATLTDAASQTVQYAYDAQGRLSTVTQTDGTVRTYVYENASFPNLLTGLEDESGHRFATWGYDSQGRATSATGPNGAGAITVVYNSNGSVTITDALGAVRTFTLGRYGERNVVTGISGSQCATCREPKATTYDAAGWVTSRTDYNDNVTCYAHDAVRGVELVRVEGFAPTSTCPANLASYTPASGTTQRKVSTTWHPSYRVPSEIVEAKRTTSFTFDSQGNVLTTTVTDTSVSPNVSRTWTFTYNGFGRVLTADGPRTDVSDVTMLSYYTCSTGGQCGQLQFATNALNQTTTYNSYNAYGLLLTMTDPNGVFTTLAYDLRQRLTLQQVGTEATAVEYWPTGLLKKVTLPDASYVLYTYDDAQRLTEVSDGPGSAIAYTLDAMGNRTAEDTFDASNTLRRTHTRVFDALSRLYQDVNAAGTAAVTTNFGYDSNGNATSINAPLGRNTANVYDALNRLTQITDPGSGITELTYDADDNLMQVIDPRTFVTAYEYTGFGEIETVSSPDTGTTTNTYDAAGNLATSTDARGAVATYEYDALNRLTSVGYSQGGSTDQTITYSYDAGINGQGQLTGAADAQHSMSWTHDAFGRVTSKSQTVTGVTKSVSYSYTNGNLTSLTTPSGQSVLYGYNTNGQVASITINGSTLLSGVSYEPFGPVKGWTWGNASTMSRMFDNDGKVTAIASAGEKTYGYDDAFRITGITDTITPTDSYTFGFDELDRLTSAAKTGTTRGWTYDANGNRLSETGAAPSAYTISSTDNRVSAISGSVSRSYSYDAAGNTLTYSNITATYNNRGRMSTLTKGATTATFSYNALGELVKRAGGLPGTVHYVYDEAGHLLGEYDGTGALIQETIWLGDTPVATLRPGTPVGVFYVHTDHLNTPRKVTRPSDNQPRWTWESDPFGTDPPNDDPASLGTFTYNLRFPGQIYDAHTELNYNYFRDYDAVTGRYVQSDPIGLAGGINTYGFVGGNPLGSVDPLGLQATAPVAVPGPGPLTIPEVGIWGTPANDEFVDAVNGLLGGAPSSADIVCFLNPLLCPRMMNEGGDANGDTCPTPETHPDDFVKLKGGQGYRDRDGNLWNKDRLHKDHWDVSDRRGNKVREIDFGGRQIWPGGPKNRNKEP